MGRYLIINADDFGWSEEVNAGIIETHRQGVVTSTTLMTTMPGAEDAITRLRGCPELGVGIHLTLTAGVAVSGDESVREALGPGGRFASSTLRLLGRARTSGRWRRAAEAELSAQVQWALEHGVKPDHLDSHKHFHVVKPFPEMVVRVAKRFGIRLVRNTCERKRVRLGHVGAAARVRRRLLLHWGKRAAQVFEEASLVQPETLFGVEDTGRPSLERARVFLGGCSADRVEWMVHPGNREEKAAWATRLGDSREEEKKMLISTGVRDMIAGLGFQLVRYEELLK